MISFLLLGVAAAILFGGMTTNEVSVSRRVLSGNTNTKDNAFLTQVMLDAPRNTLGRDDLPKCPTIECVDSLVQNQARDEVINSPGVQMIAKSLHFTI